MRNILNLLDVQYAGANMKIMCDILTGRDQEKRANALEVLDNLIVGKDRPLIMRLFEPDKKEKSTQSPEEIIRHIWDLEFIKSDWLIAGSLYAIGKNKLHSCITFATGALISICFSIESLFICNLQVAY